MNFANLLRTSNLHILTYPNPETPYLACLFLKTDYFLLSRCLPTFVSTYLVPSYHLQMSWSRTMYILFSFSPINLTCFPIAVVSCKLSNILHYFLGFFLSFFLVYIKNAQTCNCKCNFEMLLFLCHVLVFLIDSTPSSDKRFISSFPRNPYL